VTYSFNVEHAKRYGQEEAVILQNFIFWLRQNKANKKNQRDGRTWTYNSVRAFGELFPFWTARQIDRILRSLISKGVLIKGSYNQANYDKTSWYALADESLLQLPDEVAPITPNGEMDSTERGNGSHQTVRPIPDSKPDRKPKERELSPDSAPLPEPEKLRARLQRVARETIGTETPHVVHALELVKGGADPDQVVNAWERMLKTKPNSAAFFGKDFATRWKAKQIEDDGHCPECHVRLDLGYLHLRECSRRKSA
jgi:DNA polymerase III gamma/tau subunit